MMVSSISLRTALELCGISRNHFVELWSSSQDMRYVSVSRIIHQKGILDSRVYSIKPRFETLSGKDFVCMSFKVDQETMEKLGG